jgi:glycosyltransferase involved in cell wall biosynthesis
MIEFSHCAFSMKARRWAPMMAPLGYDCIYYGAGEPDTPGWSEYVEVMSPAEQEALLGYDPVAPQSSAFVGRSAHVDSALYKQFNQRLAALLKRNVEPDDWICAPFGHGHAEAVYGMLSQTIETGIGYPTCMSGYRIYESYAWLNWHLGRDRREAWVTEWVVPNYFDLAEWPQRPTPPREGTYVLYMGRIQKDKGLNVVWQLARARPDLEFIVCGQGDATPWLTETNLHYRPPVHGLDRATLMHGARCVLMPTEFVEPFGGVAVEALLTGTPVLTSDHGVFNETNENPLRRCHTLGDWLTGLDLVLEDDGRALRERAITKYSLEAVGLQYDKIFQALPAIKRDGWSANSVMEMAS